MSNDAETTLKLRLEIAKLFLSIGACFFAAGSWLKSCQTEALARVALEPDLEVNYIEVSPGSFDPKHISEHPVFGGRVVIPREFDVLREGSANSVFFEASNQFFESNAVLAPVEDEGSETTIDTEDDFERSIPAISERVRIVFLQVRNQGGSVARDVKFKFNRFDAKKSGIRLATHEVRPRGRPDGIVYEDSEIFLGEIPANSAVLVPLCFLAQFIVDEDDWDYAIGHFLQPKSISFASGKKVLSVEIRKKREFPFLIEQGYETRG